MWWASCQVEQALAARCKTKIFLKHSQLCHRGEYWHISVSAWQQSRLCGQNLRGPFLCTSVKVEASARLMAANGRTKMLVTPPTRWVVSAPNYVFVSAQYSDHKGGVNPCRPFLAHGFIASVCMWTAYVQ